ncbi:hypothetical protein [Halobacillus karajensis]|nr:hypothetical protein [Halobacillus karajensis]
MAISWKTPFQGYYLVDRGAGMDRFTARHDLGSFNVAMTCRP